MPTMTMKQLYAQRTGDTQAHQRAIDARFRRLDARRQRILRQLLAGATYRMIGEQEGGISAGSVQSAINSAIEVIRKGLAGEPRFNRIGSPGRRGAAARKSGTPADR